jgi:7,8-dihydropterin-6-yl-methyl-4-(beta-D-ribofuranosyl)aminobenzene 5'-phosphate synthase
VEWRGEVVPLEPVDAVSVLTVCDNSIDLLLLDQGPARRFPVGDPNLPMIEAPVLENGKSPDAPLAQHGFSALVEIRKNGAVRRMLFDAGTTPNGCVENLRRLGREKVISR